MTGTRLSAVPTSPSRNRKSYQMLLGVMVLLAAGLMFYAQTDAFAWDEGWHVLAAQSLTRGKRLYLDFNYSQTPLNAYWNALWFTVFGASWRTAHAVAALMTTAAIFLTADYLYTRFPIERWRTATAIQAALLLSLNVLIVQYGPIGQAYGLCLFLLVAAFRLAVSSVERESVWFAALAGFCSSAAAGASLLTAPVCPVLALWMTFRNRPDGRWKKLAAFLAAAVIPFLPVVYSFIRAPRQTLFDIIQYNLVFRQVEWEGAIGHDIGVLMSWLNSAQALLAGLLGLTGLLFIRFRSHWTAPQRAEAYLCGWLALALGVHISSAHPTFPRYYLFTFPFVVILAIAGICFLATTLFVSGRPFWLMAGLTMIFSLELAKALHDKHPNVNWGDLEKIAAKVDQVTPPNGTLLSDEPIYFLTRRPPPHGMELADSHKLEFPPEKAIPLNLVPESEVLRQVHAGQFHTVVNCDKNYKLTDDDLETLYRDKYETETCNVFWNWKR